MDVLSLVGLVKDPAVVAFLVWAVAEIRGLRAQVDGLGVQSAAQWERLEKHGERVTRLEERTRAL